jgi:hypothetical protein
MKMSDAGSRSEHFERACFEHVTAGTTERARAVDALARSREIAAADWTGAHLMRFQRSVVVALRYNLSATRTVISHTRHELNI